MWDWSDAAREALRGGHTAVSRVDIWHSGKPVYTFPDVTGGGVNTEAGRPVLRNLSATLVDSTGALSTGDVDDLLDPYECEIAVWRGVRYLNNVLGIQYEVVELAPQGVFGLTGREVNDSPDGLVIRITGQDRAMTYQGPMESALAISGGTPVETAVALLASKRHPGVALSAMSTGFTCGPLIYPPDTDVWQAIQELAISVGARAYHDRTGQLVLAPAGPPSDRPVAVYEQGDGLLLDVARSEDADTIRNVVVAENPSGTIRVTAEDTDPTSPTFARGRYGRRVYTLVNQHFGSTTQAQVAATARLAYELGRSEVVSFTAVVDPGLDVDEVVTVHRPRAGLNRRGVVTSSIDLPLAADDAMSVTCRQSQLAPDGEVVGEP